MHALIHHKIHHKVPPSLAWTGGDSEREWLQTKSAFLWLQGTGPVCTKRASHLSTASCAPPSSQAQKVYEREPVHSGAQAALTVCTGQVIVCVCEGVVVWESVRMLKGAPATQAHRGQMFD